MCIQNTQRLGCTLLPPLPFYLSISLSLVIPLSTWQLFVMFVSSQQSVLSGAWLVFISYISLMTSVTLGNIDIYRIAGNFRGSKLSRIRPKMIFTDLIFANFYYSAILYHIIYNFANFIFANLKKSQKEWKLLVSKVSGYTVIYYL